MSQEQKGNSFQLWLHQEDKPRQETKINIKTREQSQSHKRKNSEINFP